MQELFFNRNKYMNLISVSVIGIISILYVYKYSEVYTNYSLLITLFYALVFPLSLLIIEKIKFGTGIFSNKLLTFSLIALSLISFAVITFTPRIGEVGRYPAIVDWLDLFFAGLFPYNSMHTPSSFPFAFFLYSPFYFIGNVGYLETLGLILFFIALLKFGSTPKEKWIALIVLLISPVIYYEHIVRCELFTNSMLAIAVIIISEKILNPSRKNLEFFLTAVLFGLILSTRSVVILIYAVYLLYKFRVNIPGLLLFSFTAFIVFSLTLIPFILWDYESFIKNGPFAIQSFLSHLPFWFIILIILFSIYIGWIVSNITEIFFAAGLLLFLPVAVSMVIKIFQIGFYDAIVNDIFDLSYYAFSLPFLLLSLKEYKVGLFTGRIQNEI
jgi:hypothetical protein